MISTTTYPATLTLSYPVPCTPKVLKLMQILSPRGYDTHLNTIQQIYLIISTAEAVLLTAHA